MSDEDFVFNTDGSINLSNTWNLANGTMNVVSQSAVNAVYQTRTGSSTNTAVDTALQIDTEKPQEPEKPKPRPWFRKGNIIWVHDPKQDTEETDRRGQTRVIKRFVPFNRTKDYKAMKALKSLKMDDSNTLTIDIPG